MLFFTVAVVVLLNAFLFFGNILSKAVYAGYTYNSSLSQTNTPATLSNFNNSAAVPISKNPQINQLIQALSPEQKKQILELYEARKSITDPSTGLDLNKPITDIEPTNTSQFFPNNKIPRDAPYIVNENIKSHAETNKDFAPLINEDSIRVDKTKNEEPPPALTPGDILLNKLKNSQ